MKEHELEDVMIKFLERHADVLLCTTIIESGLDIPNANTIIINRADMFGLAQLYQLRGRVGRSSSQAYAYLLTPKGDAVVPVAQKRLALLQKYTDLGSGFQIAMHDLEIRGAGNILGVQQSGHIDAIGYEMYLELLEKTINRLQGKIERQKIDTEILFPLAAYISEDYVANEDQRLILYRRLASIENVDGLEKFEEELIDRFGPIPELVKNLLSIVELKIMAKEILISSIQYDGNALVFKFNSQTTVKPQTILNLINKEPKRFAFKPPETLYVACKGLANKEILSHAKSIIINYFK
jgi:transcription-repair coupling factor (superfamily II helicase)